LPAGPAHPQGPTWCVGLGRGRRGRVDGAGRQPELGLALKLPPNIRESDVGNR